MFFFHKKKKKVFIYVKMLFDLFKNNCNLINIIFWQFAIKIMFAGKNNLSKLFKFNIYGSKKFVNKKKKSDLF